MGRLRLAALTRQIPDVAYLAKQRLHSGADITLASVNAPAVPPDIWQPPDFAPETPAMQLNTLLKALGVVAPAVEVAVPKGSEDMPYLEVCEKYGVQPSLLYDGNGLCWYNSDRTYSRCCAGGDAARAGCWSGPWYTEDFCCHPLPPGHERCFQEIEGRALAKLAVLERFAGGVDPAGGAGREHWDPEEAVQQLATYQYLVSQPVSLWLWACSAPESPLLWSDGCSCCDPPQAGCSPGGPRDEPGRRSSGHRRCCHPVLARRAQEAPDPSLEAAIQAHVGPGLRVRRGAAAAAARSARWQLTPSTHAGGCLIAVRAGRAAPCDEARACPGFDCSYARALVAALDAVSAAAPLPDLDLLVNAGDVTLRGWTNTLALPVEWQLHPGQCLRHLSRAARAAEAAPWEHRAARLAWRGAPSNCRAARCRPGAPEGEHRDCTWNASTWLSLQRGRLVWLSRFAPSLSRGLVRSPFLPLHSELERFLEDLGLLSEPMSIEEQAQYKYTAALEGDSAADRLYWQLFTGSVVLVPEGPWQELALRELLEPYVHYVPVRYDLSDLVDRVSWLRENDDEARRIAQRALTFAQRHLTCDGVLYFLDRLLRAYAQKVVE
ncbi:unnamed protein product [Prorocentrum cordatum]|uniref:Glycosyl transferase CAP10 domain-containing protein n=1 Tax=Prorocentrum cordatum TaxID=2364126 RepID=A0ABN9SBK3_9DINO|nr:unnamed protein product [Polarella glacialis]